MRCGHCKEEVIKCEQCGKHFNPQEVYEFRMVWCYDLILEYSKCHSHYCSLSCWVTHRIKKRDNFLTKAELIKDDNARIPEENE